EQGGCVQLRPLRPHQEHQQRLRDGQQPAEAAILRPPLRELLSSSTPIYCDACAWLAAPASSPVRLLYIIYSDIPSDGVTTSAVNGIGRSTAAHRKAQGTLRDYDA
ncbi:hypothetical protein AVEN_9173-1, partial [Araneus ventricosus]